MNTHERHEPATFFAADFCSSSMISFAAFAFSLHDFAMMFRCRCRHMLIAMPTAADLLSAADYFTLLRFD